MNREELRVEGDKLMAMIRGIRYIMPKLSNAEKVIAHIKLKEYKKQFDECTEKMKVIYESEGGHNGL